MSAGYIGKVHSPPTCPGDPQNSQQGTNEVIEDTGAYWAIKRLGDILIHSITTSGQDQESGRNSVQQGPEGRKPHQGRAEVASWPHLWTRDPTLQG